ncbi:MAG: carbamoyl-phosphate synthase large subunit, partial [Gammaproteobacteria bacterium]|nr:carbamoyl-phosphate synthase large subunit [Gammaproteobacteria bacterium]
MDFDGEPRTVAFIAQDRSVRNGVWGPEHHLAAAELVGECSKRNIAIVSLMDTPGADPGEVANKNNQAHSISRLIAEMANVDVPNLGIIFGLGYSGGAIPLAASNLILSVRNGVFSTIQPKGLANIARRLNLSWQECAKYVGLSPYELYDQGNIDGIIDYAPGDPEEKIENLRLAIVTGIQSVEASTRQFVADNPYILDHYRHNLERYLKPSRRLQQMEQRAFLRVSKTPTEYMNVFGVAYRYLRYLSTRKRIKATTTKQYGRLADRELPKGELSVRADRERRQTFLKWMQDPEKVIYDDALAKAWKNYTEKKEGLDEERGRIAQLLFGEPKKNFNEARASLLTTVSTYLYNRWKNDAEGNFKALIKFLKSPDEAGKLLRVGDISDPRGLAVALGGDRPLGAVYRERFSHEGKKLLSPRGLREKADNYLRNQLTTELNLTMTEGAITESVDAGVLSERARTLAAA